MNWKKAKAAHLKLGRRGERLAVRLVKELGLTVLGRNYRVQGGEIDIIALDGDTICFIEVKSRDNSRHQLLQRPSDAVGYHKKNRLRRAAKTYLCAKNYPSLMYRFDVIEVTFEGRRLKTLNWIPSFFKMEQGESNGFEFE